MRHLLVLDTGGAEDSPLFSPGRDLASALAAHEAWYVSHHDLRGAISVPQACVDLIRRLAHAGHGSAAVAVVLRGSLERQRRVLWAVVAAGLRPRVRVVLHLRVAEVPLGPGACDVFPLADLIVAESAFGVRAAISAASRQALTLRRSPIAIPPLPDAGTRLPPGGDRSAARRSWDLPAAGPVVGCSGGGPNDPRAFLALQLFRAFAQGLYRVCERCHEITPFALDDTLAPVDTPVCAYCRALAGSRGPSRPEAVLLVLDGALTARPAGLPQPHWSLDEYADACGLRGRVRVKELRGRADAASKESLRAALLAMDVHLVPHHLADVESAVLAGCALGVPTIATDYGAATEILGSYARLVPPCALTYTSEGSVAALMDASRAICELRALLPSNTDPADGRAMPTAAQVPRGALAADAWRRQLELLWAEA